MLSAKAEAFDAKSDTGLTFTRRDLGRELNWERYRVARAIEPLELDGWFEIVDRKSRPYAYRLTWDQDQNEKIDLLAPDELEADLAAHVDEIDPVYLG